jgi:hypothetical protein
MDVLESLPFEWTNFTSIDALVTHFVGKDVPNVYEIWPAITQAIKAQLVRSRRAYIISSKFDPTSPVRSSSSVPRLFR